MSNPKRDEKRPLDETGIAQCRYVGRALTALDVSVDVILSSPLKRATQTASLVGNEIGHEGELILEDGLRPGATYDEFRQMLDRYVEYESLMIVGHNPNQSEFLRKLIGSDKVGLEMKKGSVARLDWKQRVAELQWYITPRVLKGIYDSSAASSRPKTSRK